MTEQASVPAAAQTATMTAATLAGPGRIELKDLPKPEITETAMALVRITRAGICGSDLYLYDGRMEIEPDFPLGHEYVGVVEEVGPDVRLIEVGDRVAGSFSVSCGRCSQCQRGQHARCLMLRFFGFGFAFGDLPGAQSQYIAVPEADLTLRKVPEGVSDDAAVLIGDNIVTAVDVLHRGRFEAGHVVAVMGAGPTGLLTAQAALALGAGAVVISDPQPHRLRCAESFGATAVDITSDDPADAVLELSGYQGADLVVDATSTAQAASDAVALARKGGVIAVTTVHADGELTIPLGEMWLKDLELVMHQVNVQARLDEVVGLVTSGRLSPEVVISHRLPLEEAAAGYAVSASREALKVVLTPGA
jgi:2-desacetyl-2-hydroxyethyl bacteriochlorophyllide A dehydrogenase